MKRTIIGCLLCFRSAAGLSAGRLTLTGLIGCMGLQCSSGEGASGTTPEVAGGAASRAGAQNGAGGPGAGGLGAGGLGAGGLGAGGLGAGGLGAGAAAGGNTSPGSSGGAPVGVAGGPSGVGGSGVSHDGFQDITYPEGVVVRVTDSPYAARGDGVTDDTEALQRALDDVAGFRKVMYFPEGTYLVSDTLVVPSTRSNGTNSYGHTHLQGQNQGSVVIRLRDQAAGFGTSATPKPVITHGRHGSADWFGNSVRNLTIDTGTGNPGAIGLQFFSNNYGCVRDVTIRSGDGAGVNGLDLSYNDMNGPLLVKHTTVEGFQFGITLGGSVNSATFEHVALRNQSDTGFHNGGQAVSMRGLHAEGAPRGVFNRGTMTLLDSTLAGVTAGGAAIRNEGVLFARALTTSGYGAAIDAMEGRGESQAGPDVSEYVSGAVLRLGSTKTQSLNLPIEETPEVPWDDPADWVSVVAMGADPTAGADSAAAIQAAIDSGATTVYFPKGTYRLGASIILRGSVRRLLGMSSNLDYVHAVPTSIRVEDGSEPVVVIDRLDTGGTIELATSRAVVLLDSNPFGVAATGTGDVFVENVSTLPRGAWTFGGHRVFARQINPENDGTHILNNGGTLWILGLKTERGGTLIHTEAGGTTELLGGFSYTTTDPLDRPMFIINESSFSATFSEVTFGPPRFDPVISETVAGTTSLLRPADGVPRWVGGSVLPLYVGY